MAKRIFLPSVMLAAALLSVGGCTPKPVRPAMSQTVVTIQRHPSKTLARSPMHVFIDGTKSSHSVANGESVSIAVNDGVHYIYVAIGKKRSETLNFTAAQKTVSFVASAEGSALRWLFGAQPKKVSLSRSKVIDDTGEMTDKAMQKEFVPDD